MDGCSFLVDNLRINLLTGCVLEGASVAWECRLLPSRKPTENAKQSRLERDSIVCPSAAFDSALYD